MNITAIRAALVITGAALGAIIGHALGVRLG